MNSGLSFIMLVIAIVTATVLDSYDGASFILLMGIFVHVAFISERKP